MAPHGPKLALLAALLAPACNYSPNYGDGQLKCTPQGGCPGDLVCAPDLRCRHAGNMVDASVQIDVATVVDGSQVDVRSIDAASIDAGPIDATPFDSPPATAPMDIAYASDWTICQTTGVGAPFVGLIVDVGSTAIDLTQLRVTSSSDDDATVVFTMLIQNPATYSLPAGQAGGMLTSGASPWVTPLVTEPIFNNQRPTFDFTLNNIPSPYDKVVHATGVIVQGNQQITLPFTFTIKSSGCTQGGSIIAAKRVRSVAF